MSKEIIEFQKLRIEALEAENQRLKTAMVRKESSLRDYLKRLSALINDDAFNKPIHNVNYDSNKTMA